MSDAHETRESLAKPHENPARQCSSKRQCSREALCVHGRPGKCCHILDTLVHSCRATLVRAYRLLYPPVHVYLYMLAYASCFVIILAHAYMCIHRPGHLFWTYVAKASLCNLTFLHMLEHAQTPSSTIQYALWLDGPPAAVCRKRPLSARARPGATSKTEKHTPDSQRGPLGATLGGGLRVPAGRCMATCEC